MAQSAPVFIKHFMPESEPLVKIIGDGPANAKGEIATTVIRVSPTPFGSPSRKDLQGQFFISPTKDDSGTIFGDEIWLSKGMPVIKPGLYEHGINEFNNPEFEKFGKMANLLGPAQLVKVEGDPTRWFDIEVRRSLQYHDWLMDLIDLKVMGASTQAFRNNVEVRDDGGILYWLESEIGPTVSPANPDSIKLMSDMYQKNKPKYVSLPPMTVKMWKSSDELVDVIIGEEDSMPKKKTTEEESRQEELEKARNAEDIAGTSLVDEIEQILNEDETEDNSDEAVHELIAVSPEELQKMIENSVKAQMSFFMELWGADHQEAKEAILSLMGSAKSVNDLNAKLDTMFKGQEDLKKAFLGFAKYLKEMKMSVAAKEYNQMSEFEREILDRQEERQQPNPQRKSLVPPGAPGTY